MPEITEANASAARRRSSSRGTRKGSRHPQRDRVDDGINERGGVMFKCNVCNKSSRSGESCTRRVVETRIVNHPKREWANDPGGVGTQIVREAKLCPRCVEPSSMTREQIEAHIGRLESIAITNWASPLDREAVDFAIARLRADLDAMPVGETRQVRIAVFTDGDRVEACSMHPSVPGEVIGVNEARRHMRDVCTNTIGLPMSLESMTIIVADIPVRQVPVVNGKVSK